MELQLLSCNKCGIKFSRSVSAVNRELRKRCKQVFCSKTCYTENRKQKHVICCTRCNKTIIKTSSKLKKSISGNSFCSKSCAATYNNTHKTKGYRRSKLETYLEEQLKIIYPNLEIKFNDKTVINSELDIYIPSLSLAFELNGIFHYEPIYGSEKLTQIQNNDINKFQICQKTNISLCIIDTSSQKYFKIESSKRFLSIINKIIFDLVENVGFEPTDDCSPSVFKTDGL